MLKNKNFKIGFGDIWEVFIPYIDIFTGLKNIHKIIYTEIQK